jgi:DNA-binding transcriptional MerR regulator
VQQFSELAGVTVRALHHYDRLALLKPRRTDAGYRVYSVSDLDRLERIVALKFLGLPLKQIKAVLDRDTRALPAVLRGQRRALEEKRRQLDIAIEAIRDAEQTVQASGAADASVIRRIIEVIEMQENTEYFKQFYSDEAWAELEKRRAEMTPEMRQRAEDGTRRWMELFHDVEAAIAAKEDPAGDTAQQLGRRWQSLIHEFTLGHQGVSDGLGKVWANKEQWPAQMQKQAAPFMDPKIWDYIGQVFAASRKR